MARTGHERFGTGREGNRGGRRPAGGALAEAAGTASVVGEEVAHVRARFAVDPSTPTRFADAWTAPTGTTEEDESELIDAVADCLSVGLPLDAAVASWRAGSLQIDDHPEDDEDEDDEDTDVFGRRDDDKTDVY
jgi:hypothetical protein